MGLFDAIGDFLGIGGGDAPQIPASKEAQRFFGRILTALGGNPNEAIRPALDQIIGLLNAPGRLDPTARLRGEQAINRGTRAAQQRAARSFARRGLASSGVAEAVQAAIGASGQGRISDLQAQELRLQEALRRQDIQQGLAGVIGLLVNPALSAFGTERGVQVQNAQLQAQADQSFLNLLGAVAGAAGAAVACWAARAVYGPSDPRWLKVRSYILKHASPDLREDYLEHGPALAVAIKEDPELKAELKPIFDDFLEYVEEQEGK